MADEEIPTPKLVAHIGAILKRHDRKEAKATRAAIGKLPDWVPLPIIEKAHRLVAKLLRDGFTPKQIAKMVKQEAADKLIVPGIVRDADAFVLMINELAHIRYASSLECENGLLLLAGKVAKKGLSFSSGGGPKKGREYEPKASIRTICNHIGSFEFEKVMGFLRDEDCCGDLFHSTNSPINSQFGVDDDENVIYYTPRGSSPDQQKKITFSRLRNILSAVKKKT